MHASDDTDTTDSTVLVEAVPSKEAEKDTVMAHCLKPAVSEIGIGTSDRAEVADAIGSLEGNAPAVPSKEAEKDTVMVPGVGKMRQRDLDLLRAVHKRELDVEDDCVPDLSMLNPAQMLHLEAFLDSPVEEATKKVQVESPRDCKESNDIVPHWEERLSPYRGALLRKQGQASSTARTTQMAIGAPPSVCASNGHEVRGAPPGLENVARGVPRTIKPIGSAP